MKRLSFSILFSCFTLALVAQESIRVNYQSLKPTIYDFVWAFLSSKEHSDESFNAIKHAWILHRNDAPLPENVRLTIDQENGFVVYEARSNENILKIRMCYWDEIDQKHKLFAYKVDNANYSSEKVDRLIFYRYNNTSKMMDMWDNMGKKIAYVEVDSIMENYTFCKEYKAILESRSKKIDSALASFEQNLQSAMQNYKKKQQNNEYKSSTEAERHQTAILRQQELYLATKDKLTSELQSQTEKFNIALHDSLEHFLAKYNKDKKYSLFLSTKQGDKNLIADKAFDITNEVICELNKAYKRQTGNNSRRENPKAEEAVRDAREEAKDEGAVGSDKVKEAL